EGGDATLRCHGAYVTGIQARVSRRSTSQYHGAAQLTRWETVFNWSSLPTFAAMLLFWLLAAYVLTRSPRSAISLTAVAAQVATACYLLGTGMSANAET